MNAQNGDGPIEVRYFGPAGWVIVDSPPIVFRRYNHQAAQMDPLPGGELRDLFRFTNLANDSQGQLLLVVLASYLIPNIPHPVLVVHGPQGSAKRTLLRISRLWNLNDRSDLGARV